MSKLLAKAGSRRNDADLYLKWVRLFPLRPIRTAADYERATKVMMKLAAKGEDHLTAGERDYLDAITVFVTRYDDEHHGIPKSGPIDCLRYLMEESAMKPVDLGQLVGGRAQASLILNGKRELSKANIRALAERFKVSPALFL